MATNIQYLPISGNLLHVDSVGNNGVNIVVLTAVANGSVLVPLSCNSDGQLLTGSPL